MTIRTSISRLGRATLLATLLAVLVVPMHPVAADYNPTVNIGDTTVVEGNSGTTNAVFTVSMTLPSQNTVTILYSTQDGSAQQGVAYQYTAGSLVLPPGTTTKTISVPVIGNLTPNQPAGNKTFSVSLLSATNAILGASTGTGTIYEDDVLPALSITSTALPHGLGGTNSNAVFPVALSPASAVAVSVKYSTSNSSTIAGLDYAATSGVLNFAPGVTSKNINVPVFGRNGVLADSTFSVTLASPVNSAPAHQRRDRDAPDRPPDAQVVAR